jgi:hypothetical protein
MMALPTESRHCEDPSEALADAAGRTAASFATSSPRWESSPRGTPAEVGAMMGQMGDAPPTCTECPPSDSTACKGVNPATHLAEARVPGQPVTKQRARRGAERPPKGVD